MSEWRSCVRCGVNRQSKYALCSDCAQSDPDLHPGRPPTHVGCTVDGCGGRHHARGLCKSHYNSSHDELIRADERAHAEQVAARLVEVIVDLDHDVRTATYVASLLKSSWKQASAERDAARSDEKAKADLATSMWEQEVARLRAELDEALERAACWREKYIIEDVLENVTPEEVVRATDKARATLAERNRIRDRINSRYERVHAEHGGGVGYWEGYLDALGTVVSRDVEED